MLADQITDSRKWQRLNGWLVIIWIAIFPVAIISGLVFILAFTAIISLYSNVVGHLSVWAAARAENSPGTGQ